MCTQVAYFLDRVPSVVRSKRSKPWSIALLTTAATASLRAANASRAADKKSNILLIRGDDKWKGWEVSQNACD
jgi:hypothetical protein